MSERLALQPSEQDIDCWMVHFVPELVLWWWNDSPIPNELQALRVLDRRNCRNDPVVGNIAYVNAFHTWAMHEDAVRVIVDDGHWIASLSDEDRYQASKLQVSLDRGLCIPKLRFSERAAIPKSAVADGRVVLYQQLWTNLGCQSKRAVIESELAEWDRDTAYPLPGDSAPHVAEIANTFVRQEGVNCLSVTAYTLTADPADLYQWMMPEEFGAILEGAGYAQIEVSDPMAGDVIVFQDEEENVVHAAYVIQPDRILNKSGQSSFNPIAIIDLDNLKEDWPTYSLGVFRRAAANSSVP